MKISLSSQVEHALLLNGWHPNRRINIRPIYLSLKSKGYHVHHKAIQFYQQFGGIILNRKSYICPRTPMKVGSGYYSYSIGFGVNSNGKRFFSGFGMILEKYLSSIPEREQCVLQSIQEKFNESVCLIAHDHCNYGESGFLPITFFSCRRNLQSVFTRFFTDKNGSNIYMLESGRIIKDYSQSGDTMLVYPSLDCFFKEFFEILSENDEKMIKLLDISEFQGI